MLTFYESEWIVVLLSQRCVKLSGVSQMELRDLCFETRSELMRLAVDLSRCAFM